MAYIWEKESWPNLTWNAVRLSLRSLFARARAIADMSLAHAEQSPQRFYSMSAQILSERSDYSDKFGLSQRATTYITT